MKEFYVGQTASISKSFSLEDVTLFSKLSEDVNPIHLNEKYASESFFKKRIVHGFLYSSLISGVIANQLPGPGSVYLHQDMDFLKPVYHNEPVTAVVKILFIDDEKNILHLETICYKNDNIVVVKGKAIIKLV